MLQWNLVPSFFIFKVVKPRIKINKDIPANEIPPLDEDTRKLMEKSGMKVYQKYTAWMNNRVMTKYYLPYYREKTKTIPSLLVLDNCAAHCHNDVIKELNDAKTGVAHLHLAPNTTPICQPVDISIGRSLKSKVREQFENWLVNNFEELVEYDSAKGKYKFKAPTKALIIEWVLRAYEGISSEVIRKSTVNLLKIN